MNKYRKKFSKIYDRYIDKIYRFVLLKVNSEEVAQDLTSETFLRTWNKFREKKGNPIRNPRAFLYQTAHNLVIDYYRKRDRTRDRTKVVSLDDVLPTELKMDLEKEILAKDDLCQLRLALAELNEDYQNVLIWHYLDDLSIKEIAGLLGRTKQATRVLLHRGLKSLKKNMEKNIKNKECNNSGSKSS